MINLRALLLCVALATSAESATYVSNNAWCNQNCNAPVPYCPPSFCQLAPATPPAQKDYYRVYPYQHRNNDMNIKDNMCSTDCNHNPPAASCGWHCIETGTPNHHTFYTATDIRADDEWCYNNCNNIPPYCPAGWCEGIPSTQGVSTPAAKPSPSGSNGDPHFKTWANEHFEYHGQCDMVLATDKDFADGLGLDVQIRTKLVRFWSYIKSVGIRIGDDILEIQGAGELDYLSTANYWMNFEYQAELSTVGGFPVTLLLKEVNSRKRVFTIDLSSRYPGVKIVVAAFREFIRVDFENHSEEAFGNVAGMLGNYKTGKTLARDGVTVIDDFSKLGNEWQLLPVEDMLFHNTEQPQFPKKCFESEDPQGARRRRLAEMTVSEEQAEAACAFINDPLDKKDCIYDIMATQDLDMVGAF